MLTIREPMHVHRTYQVSVSLEPTDFAGPLPVFRLLFMPAARTLTRCASFRASEARDVGLFGFVAEIVNILAIFPQRHPLMVVSAVVVVTHTMRIPNEERTDVLLHTEVDHFAGGFVLHITYALFSASALFVVSTLQLLPPARILLAAGLLFRNLPHMPVALSFEGTDTTPSYDDGLTCIRRGR